MIVVEFLLGPWTFLSDKFEQFGLNLTHEVSKKKLVLLDIEIYIENNMFHTKEHRKETSSKSYIKFGSAHPSYTFKGIIKSQMYRLRRLCSKKSDFLIAVDDLKIRCINSGYDKLLVNSILNQADTLNRSLVGWKKCQKDSDMKIIRWVILSGSSYEKTITNFTCNINDLVKNHKIKLELVKCTGSNLGSLLFNNREKFKKEDTCDAAKCIICKDGVRSSSYEVSSKVTSYKYNIDRNINYKDRGIYRITCPCTAAYTGKTTTSFLKRFNEHFKDYNDSSVNDHRKTCLLGRNQGSYKIQFLENSYNRGKYTLSEREYLWNERLGGEINVQKILKNS